MRAKKTIWCGKKNRKNFGDCERKDLLRWKENIWCERRIEEEEEEEEEGNTEIVSSV